ncbi:MAG: FAD-binding oxidoreductase [Spirochaetes bacterium]|nr:FAD-binding oxidoreductase [Spirochaetota bacterium]
MITDKNLQLLSDHNSVETSPEALRRYELYNPLIEGHRAPRCAIKPKDVGQLQRVIRTAKDESLGLVPVSSEGPHLKGGTACGADHAVVDLSHWKSIPWVNKRNRVCIVEPGVTYDELNRFLEKEGMTLPTPLAPRSGKSVLASVIDREPHIWPRMQWDMQDPVASTEFIYGTGELFRSGAAGGPGTLEEQRRSKGAQKMPMGPGQSDFQRILIGAQGSMGIMTWISLRTELLPSVERPMVIASDRLDRIVEYVYEAQRPWLGEQTFILNRTAAAMLMTWAGPENYGRVRGSIPEYICMQNIAGFERLPKERLQYQFEELNDMAGGNGLRFAESAGEVDAAELLKAARTPCGISDWRHAIMGHCLSVFFLSLLNKSAEYIRIVQEAAAAAGIDRERIGAYLQPVVQNHACHMEFMIPFNPQSAGEIETMKRLEADLTERLMKEKAFFSRPYGSASRRVFDNNPGNTELLKIIKEMFDPGNVLNPGKFGLTV